MSDYNNLLNQLKVQRDADMDYASNEVIAQRAMDDAATDAGMAVSHPNVANLDIEKQFKKEERWLKTLHSYRLPRSISFRRQYWVDMLRWCEWWNQFFSLNVPLDKDIKIKKQFVYNINKEKSMCIKCAILFRTAGLIKVEEKLRAVYVSNFNEEKATCTLIENWFAYNESPTLDKKKYFKVKREDICILDFNTFYAGDYVMNIPWSGTYRYFAWKLEKTNAINQLMPIINAITYEQASEIFQCLMDPEKEYVNLNMDQATVDNQTLSGANTTVAATNLVNASNEFLQKVNWYAPKDNFKDVLDSQQENLDRFKERWYAYMGIPTGNDITKQTLAADSNALKQDYTWIQMARIEAVSIFSLEVSKMFPEYFEYVGEKLEQKLMDREKTGQPEEAENDNAVKDDEMTSTKGEKEEKEVGA